MSKFYVAVGWDETPHLSAEAKADLVSSYPLHERDARTKGEPSLGRGAIYPVPLSDILIDPFEIPAWWPRAYGFDVGWNMSAAIWAAHDREDDVVYLYSEHYRAHAEPSIHAEAIRARGKWMLGAIDPASRGRGQRDGEQLLNDYIGQGLNLVLADNGVESGILRVWQRLSTGRLKVFSTLQNWAREYRVYQRDENGKVRKKNDHLLDAMRYLTVTGLDNMSVDPAYLERLGHTRPRVLTDYDPMQAA